MIIFDQWITNKNNENNDNNDNEIVIIIPQLFLGHQQSPDLLVKLGSAAAAWPKVNKLQQQIIVALWVAGLKLRRPTKHVLWEQTFKKSQFSKF